MGLRGGIIMDMDWAEGEVTFCRMKAVRPVRLAVKYRGRSAVAEIGTEYRDISGLFLK